jgi:hypothetical protein
MTLQKLHHSRLMTENNALDSEGDAGLLVRDDHARRLARRFVDSGLSQEQSDRHSP